MKGESFFCFFVLFALFIDLLTDKVQPLSRSRLHRQGKVTLDHLHFSLLLASLSPDNDDR